MRILVLGAGAVGGYFGGRLVEAGGDVTFLVRPRRAAELAADGLTIRSPRGDAVLRVKTVQSGEAAADCDVLLLCCKAYDLDGAIESLAPAVGRESMVVPLLNGLRHLDRLDRRFGVERVLGGVCAIAATLGPGGRIEHLSDFHRIAVGARAAGQRDKAAAFAALLATANCQSSLSDDILLEMWEKFVLLATLAGMTCLMRGSVGAIMTARDGEALMKEMLAECAAVAAASGYRPREPFMARTTAMLTQKGSDFTASMLRDIERGGPTEGEHILGDMLARARLLQLPAPLLRVAACHLQAYEARRAG